MTKQFKKNSIVSRSLRPQLIIAFSLMSVIPILALLNLIFPSFFPKESLSLVISVVLVLSLSGFLIIKRIIDPIIKISLDAKNIASGELSRTIDINRQDEIGDLSDALNQLTSHIKSNMDELKIYGERTKDINMQINKQVISLSGLLEISNLITSGAAIKEIFDIAVSRLAQVAQSSTVVILRRASKKYEAMVSSGIKPAILSAALLATNAYIFNKLLETASFLKIDRTTPADTATELLKLLNLRNVLVYPIFVQNKSSGLIVIGNVLENFSYTEDDGELVNIFAKQLGIAIENDFLTCRVKDLEIKDVLTGLYNQRYIADRLQDEILRAIAYQQPCAFISIKIKNLEDLGLQFGEREKNDILIRAGEILKSSVTAIDRVGRIHPDVFGVVAHKKNKKQANDLTSHLKAEMEKAFHGSDAKKIPFFTWAVVENPIDGADSATLMNKAEFILREENKNIN